MGRNGARFGRSERLDQGESDAKCKVLYGAVRSVKSQEKYTEKSEINTPPDSGASIQLKAIGRASGDSVQRQLEPET